MALLTITEVSRLGADAHGTPVLAPMMPPLAEQSIPISHKSQPSEPFHESARLVILHTDFPCCLAWGENPVATVGRHRMAANETRYYAVTAGMALAVIEDD